MHAIVRARSITGSMTWEITPALRAARRFGIGPARKLDHMVTRARELASAVTAIAASQLSADPNTDVTRFGTKLGDLTQQITRTRQAIRRQAAWS